MELILLIQQMARALRLTCLFNLPGLPFSIVSIILILAIQLCPAPPSLIAFPGAPANLFYTVPEPIIMPEQKGRVLAI